MLNIPQLTFCLCNANCESVVSWIVNTEKMLILIMIVIFNIIIIIITIIIITVIIIIILMTHL